MKIDELFQSKFFLEVACPPKIEYAEACLKAGADALKVRCNMNKVMDKLGSRSTPGTFQEEKAFYRELIDLAGDRPVGLLPGLKERFITEEERNEAVRMGFGYFITSARFAPPYLFGTKDDHLHTMIAAAAEDSDLQVLEGISLCPYTDSIELNIIPRELMGTNLVYEDILRYYAVVKHSAKPVLATAQRYMRPQDTRCFYEVGCKGLMIGGIIFNPGLEGKETPEDYYRITSQYVEEIQKL